VPSNGNSTPFSIALQILGASAGLLALVTFVGGALLWVRFDALDLAADQAVARLPSELLVVIGAHALGMPVVIAAAVALFLILIAPLEPDGKVRKRFWIWFVAFGVVGSVVSLKFLTDEFNGVELLTLALGLCLGGLAIVVVAHQQDRVRNLGWVAFAAFSLCGALLTVLRTVSDPLMEPAALLLADGERGVSGFYVGETSDRLFIAPLPGTGDAGDPFADAPIDRVVSISRDKITRLAIREPVGIDNDKEGREQAQTLLADLQQTALPTGKREVERVTTLSPVVAFAPLVHLHADEPWYPGNATSFLNDSELRFAHGECDHHEIASGEAIDRLRLGREPAYAHQAAGKGCEHQAPAYRATQHTRPGDERGRPDGLPVGQGFYLDLNRDPPRGRPEDGKVTKAGPQRILEEVPAYFEVDSERVGKRDGLRITYWLFYPLSQPPPVKLSKPISHEGDWERISVLVSRGKRKDVYIPVSVRYHFHNENRDVPWYAVKRVAAEGPEHPTHPVVFSAQASHASYPRAGHYKQEFELAGRQPFRIDDNAFACPDCPQWHTWVLLVAARDEPWYGFGGAWGDVGALPGTTGPLGPSTYKLGGRETRTDEPLGKRAPVPRTSEELEKLVDDE
jgi:hypothetical protein